MPIFRNLTFASVIAASIPTNCSCQGGVTPQIVAGVRATWECLAPSRSDVVRALGPLALSLVTLAAERIQGHPGELVDLGPVVSALGGLSDDALGCVIQGAVEAWENRQSSVIALSSNATAGVRQAWEILRQNRFDGAVFITQ